MPRMGMHGSALVAIEDEHAALATVLVLQEIGLVVDIVVDRDRSVEWAAKANYSYLICGGDDTTDVTVRHPHATRRPQDAGDRAGRARLRAHRTDCSRR
jgi:hypothetical protein